MVNVGILGTGIFAKDAHLPALTTVDAKVVAAFNRTASKAEDFAAHAKQTGHEVKVEPTFEALLQNPEVDVVDMLLPVQHNYSNLKLALDAGKAVSFEKPIAASLDEAKKIVELTDASPLPVIVLEQYVYHQGVAKVQELLPKIGKPVSFIFQGTGAFNPSNKYAATAWRLNPEHVGGYLSDGGVHQVTVLTECLKSKVEQVNAYTTQLRETSGDVDVLAASFKFENGVFGTFTYGSTFGATKKTNTLQIFGTEGSIIYDWSPGSADTVTLQVGPDSNNMGQPQVFTINESKHFSVDSEFKNFFDAVEKKDKKVVASNPRKAFHQFAVIVACVESAKKDGQQVKVAQLD
ncbi:hypothetical protein CJU89_4605 [Yarrowia sp. B02]|nr:hypothetical protein CJU89_4605 [Yarrowia sp. B02]